MEMVKLPLTRMVLVVGPLLMAFRFTAVALWSQPTGPGWISEAAVYRGWFVLCAVAALAWAIISSWNLMISAYLGFGFALVCLYQSVNLLSRRDDYGEAIYLATVYWISFAVACVAVTLLSIQYIMVTHPKAREQVRKVVDHG